MSNKRVVVEVGFSKERSGRGVFAAGDIFPSSPVCYYDGNEVNKEELLQLWKGKNSLPREYVIKVSENRYIIGHKEPKHPLGVAQLLNDYCIPTYIEHLDQYQGTCTQQVDLGELLRVIEETQAYQEASSTGSNVDFVMSSAKDKLWFRTKRRVKKGTELTYSYGSYYWLAQALRRTGNQVFKMALGCLSGQVTIQEANGDLILISVLFDRQTE